MRKVRGKMPQPQRNVTASQMELVRTAAVGLLEISAMRHCGRYRGEKGVMRVKQHGWSGEERTSAKSIVITWMAEEKTTPPKHSAPPKMNHLAPEVVRPAVMPKRIIVRLATRSGTKRTVGGLVPSSVVMLASGTEVEVVNPSPALISVCRRCTHSWLCMCVCMSIT